MINISLLSYLYSVLPTIWNPNMGKYDSFFLWCMDFYIMIPFYQYRDKTNYATCNWKPIQISANMIPPSDTWEIPNTIRSSHTWENCDDTLVKLIIIVTDQIIDKKDSFFRCIGTLNFGNLKSRWEYYLFGGYKYNKRFNFQCRALFHNLYIKKQFQQ